MASFSENILITGETGTGKDLLAKYIHLESDRSKEPFHVVNCASIHPTLFEAEYFGHKKGAFTGAVDHSIGHFMRAHKGSLVLDEISEIDIISQAKLLRAIENQEFYPVGSQQLCKVDTRVIAVSNKNLEILVQEGRFRRDLYHRLNTFTVNLPSLRERSQDIEPLVRFFARQFMSKYQRNDDIKIDPNLYDFLESNHFPGNVRELESSVYMVLALKEPSRCNLAPQDFKVREKINLLPGPVDNALSLQKLVLHTKQRKILDSLSSNGFNISRAATHLGISRQNLQYLIKRYKIKMDQ